MRTSVEGLTCLLELDSEPAQVDLTRDGLGARILDRLAEAIAAAWDRSTDPATGRPWKARARSTERRYAQERKRGRPRGTRVGYRTGAMLRSGRIRSGPRQIEPRWCSLEMDARGVDYASHFHEGGRPLVGWPPDVEAFARRQLDDAARG